MTHRTRKARLKRREEAGLTRLELARLSMFFFSPSALTQWEQGKRNPRPRYDAAWENALRKTEGKW